MRLRNFGLAAGSIFLAFIVAEFAARPLAPSDVPYWRTNPRDTVLEHKSAEFDVAYRTDIRGLRMDAPPRGPGPRVVMVGDSYTFGWGVKDGDSLPAQVAAVTGADVVNFGVPGTNPFNFYNYVTQYVPTLKPDLILVSLFMVRNTHLGGSIIESGGVDKYVAGAISTAKIQKDPERKARQSPFWRFALYRLAWRATRGIDYRYYGVDWPGPQNTVIRNAGPRQQVLNPLPQELANMRDGLLLEPTTQAARREEIEATMRLLAEMAKASNVPLGVLVFPVGWQVMNYPAGAAEVARARVIDGEIARWCGQLSLRCYNGRDALRAFARNKLPEEVYFADSHFTADANRVLSGIAVGAIGELLPNRQ